MLYEPIGHDPSRWPDSYWRASCPALPPCPPLLGRSTVDVAIIGAGYAGLNAALELVEAHGASVAVLEAAQPGWGASGRNGGFCCLGGTKLDAPAITRRIGAAGTAEWDAFEHAAVARVRDNLDRYRIDARTTETGEIQLAANARAWARMQRAGGEVLSATELRDCGLNTGVYLGGAMTRAGFGLHPYAYVTGLARAALAVGVALHGDSRVTRLTPAQDGWQVNTAQGQLQARQVLIATNGYSDERLPGWLHRRILPALSHVMVTEPIGPADLQAQGWTRHLMAYDSRTLLHYFRLLPDNRMLFGARGGMSFRPAPVARFARDARQAFDMIFPAWRAVPAAYHWNGLVCLTSSRAPYIGPVPGAPGLFLALGWHGNGVAAASEGGRCAARVLMGVADAAPRLTRRPPPRFPLPRKLALRAGMALAGLADGKLRPR